MLPIFTIATKPDKLAETLDRPVHDFEPMYQARLGSSVPIVRLDGDKREVVAATWGQKLSGKTVSTIEMPGILRKKPQNIWIRNQRCVIPANCFFGRRGPHHYLIKRMRSRLFCFAGLYSKRENEGQEQYYFSILTVPASPILSSFMEDMPVVMKLDRHKRWLKARDVSDIMLFADDTYEHWWDMFPIDPRIADKFNNDRTLLEPMGPSVKDVFTKGNEEKRKELEKYRAQRGK